VKPSSERAGRCGLTRMLPGYAGDSGPSVSDLVRCRSQNSVLIYEYPDRLQLASGSFAIRDRSSAHMNAGRDCATTQYTPEPADQRERGTNRLRGCFASFHSVLRRAVAHHRYIACPVMKDAVVHRPEKYNMPWQFPRVYHPPTLTVLRARLFQASINISTEHAAVSFRRAAWGYRQLLAKSHSHRILSEQIRIAGAGKASNPPCWQRRRRYWQRLHA